MDVVLGMEIIQQLLVFDGSEIAERGDGDGGGRITSE